jgi:hypothetical protein
MASARRTIGVSIVFIALLFIAHHLPAPIQELPETPTPAPERSIKPKPKPKPAQEATAARKSDLASTDAATKAHGASNSAGPATVFIYRPAGFPWGMYNGTVVTIDGAQTRTMADSRYSVRKLSAGRHVFEVKGGVITNQHIPIEVDLQSGQTYYFRVSIDAMGFPEGKIIFVQVPTAQGAEEIAKLKQGP